MKTLTVYFSRAGENYFGGSLKMIQKGNTEVIAEMIVKDFKTDVFRIEMKHPYSENYRKCIDEAKEDLKKGNFPEYVGDADISGYDTIILCYPNYWGTVPMVVAGFLKNHDFSGKKILPLCTNEGSGMGSSVTDIRKYATGCYTGMSLSVYGSSVNESEKDVKGWLTNNL